MDFHRFTVFLFDRKSGALECAFQTDGGGQSTPLDRPRSLAGTGCERLMSDPQSRILDDLGELAVDEWPELSCETGFRSAIIAPLVHEGDVLGAAVVRNLYPKAFGRVDESLICRAVELLIPAITIPVADQSRPLNFPAGNREISNIISVGHSIEDMLDPFADAARELIHFDFLTVAWLDRNGYDINKFQSKSRQKVDLDRTGGNSGVNRPPASIQARLRIGGENLGR